MAECKCMRGQSSSLPESDSDSESDSLSGEECEHSTSEDLPDLNYLKRTEDCLRRVQEMTLRKFNNEQCDYLAHKLDELVQNASSLRVSGVEHSRSPASMARFVPVFKLLLALAEEIESFIQSCCKGAWIQAAIPLTNVSLVGFKLELCRVAFRMDCEATGSLTMDQVADINKAESEVVEKKASMDFDSLLKNLKALENRDVALNYLFERLKAIKLGPASLLPSTSRSGIDNGGLLRNFYKKLFKKVSKPVQVIKELGTGATATVYEATWLGIRVAKKTFLGRRNPYYEKELDILSRLCHPNITSMFCCARDGGSCSIFMELMDKDLHKLIQSRRSPPFSIYEVLDIILQVAEGVKYLHGQKIVHGDLKSMNILVKSTNAGEATTGYVHVKVADFGLSKTKETSTRYSCQSFNAGSDRWMAPEIIRLDSRNEVSVSGNEKVPKTHQKKFPFKRDVYSFGMVCYEVLTGNIPFHREASPKTIKENVIKGDRPDLPNHCPKELKALIEKCWSQEPEQRPKFAEICTKLKYLKCSLLTVETEGSRLQVPFAGQPHSEEANNFLAPTLLTLPSQTAKPMQQQQKQVFALQHQQLQHQYYQQQQQQLQEEQQGSVLGCLNQFLKYPVSISTPCHNSQTLGVSIGSQFPVSMTHIPQMIHQLGSNMCGVSGQSPGGVAIPNGPSSGLRSAVGGPSNGLVLKTTYVRDNPVQDMETGMPQLQWKVEKPKSTVIKIVDPNTRQEVKLDPIQKAGANNGALSSPTGDVGGPSNGLVQKTTRVRDNAVQDMETGMPQLQRKVEKPKSTVIKIVDPNTRQEVKLDPIQKAGANNIGALSSLKGAVGGPSNGLVQKTTRVRDNAVQDMETGMPQLQRKVEKPKSTVIKIVDPITHQEVKLDPIQKDSANIRTPSSLRSSVGGSSNGMVQERARVRDNAVQDLETGMSQKVEKPKGMVIKIMDPNTHQEVKLGPIQKVCAKNGANCP